ncbi:hypothetical protein GOB86_14620 [Acetobacter lambici]|uniref:Uncharacterized protein n=1 Tax=Acetobacter lambici TaxID=1332824 RepID=A0ABT1F4M3_9PROT|nr:hypothetical protein [Acetobacter lambici]MCP1244181.1 hypothetical protein [Acetobacter lambici]MCP1260106.1 hypothetical protein [Acetobacter lambici]NHO58246.1 hypothetical protein [Acetobacter lambici]
MKKHSLPSEIHDIILITTKKRHQELVDVYIISQVPDVNKFFQECWQKEHMNYDILERHIYEINTSTYDKLDTLNKFYRYKLYEKIRKISNLDDICDAETLAYAVVNFIDSIDKNILDSFELASYSYRELLQVQRITKTRLTRKANRYRINIRRILSLSRDDDEFQLSFDNDKKERYQQIKFNGYSVQDSINRKIKNNRSRDWSISQSLNQKGV